MVTIANSHTAIVVCVVLLASIAAATGYRVEIGPGTFKFEKNSERPEVPLALPPVPKDKGSR